MSMDAPAFLGLVDDSGRVHPDFPRQFHGYCKRFVGDEVEIIVRKRKTKRSDRQNRAMWALLHEWARNQEGTTVGSLKDDVMGITFGWTDPSPMTGRVYPRCPNTSNLSVEDFCTVIEAILQLAAEHSGVVLLAPDEYRKANDAAARKAAKVAA